MIRLASLLLFLAIITPSVADDAMPDAFSADADAMAQTDAALARASARGTRLLLVFGASWCHDSRGLVSHFAQDDMEALIADRYELVYVDIGWRERNLDVLRRFGAATVYGTPTVLIYDPELGLLNADTMHSWHTAYSRSHDAVVEYFTVWADSRPASSLASRTDVYQNLIADIAAWEMREAERLNEAYARHAAWREDAAANAGDAQRNAQFRSVEADIDRHRAAIRADRDSLMAEARDRVQEALRVEAGSDLVGFDTVDRLNANPPVIALDYPAYPDRLYPWEN